ncbi:MAG: FAD-dependent oxidoreductase [Candidatus Nanopelagicales bacterium]
MTITIVGGGLAGATVATELRDSGYTEPIALFASEAHFPYERPPLSKGFLLGEKPLSSAYVHEPDWYAANNVDLHLTTPVVEIRPTDHVLETANGTQPFGQLVLATGASPRPLPMADHSGKEVVYLRTMDDSMKLKDRLANKPKVAIIGAGWIGLEVAAAARAADCEVTVFESAAKPLIGVLGPEIAQVFEDLHRAHGVDLRLDHETTQADLEDADLVVVGIGAIPATKLAKEAGLDIDNGVLVDAQLRTSHPDIYAIGDIANHDHPVLKRRIRVEHWDTAIEQAKVAAHNLLGKDEPYERFPYFFTDQYDLGMEYVGSVGPEGYDDLIIEGDLADKFRAYWLRQGKVVAAMHVNDWDATEVLRASIGNSPSAI